MKKAVIQRFAVWPLLAASLLLSGCNFETVPFVDLNRYQGVWYQIAANPTFFNDNLVGVTAEYEIQDDGSVQVTNRGNVGTLNGELDVIIGRATVANPFTNAALNVTFPGQPEFPFPNYLVVVLDELYYQYAVVTDALRSTLFVLCREPQMDPAVYAAILGQLAELGIPTDRLVLTPQAEL